MTIQYQLTEKEAVQGILKVRSRNPASKQGVMIGILLGMGLVFVATALTPGPRGSGSHIFALAVGVVSIGSISLLLRWYTKYVISRYVHANAHLYTAAYTLTLDEAGLVFTSPLIKQELAWTVFKHRLEDEHYFYLHGDSVGLMSQLPKRAFDAEALEDFRRFSSSLQPA